MSFVKLDNLNDFIQPGTACVKPSQPKAGTVAKVNDISLSDCLACSGCITTAETVLVQQQNHEELFKIINESKLSKSKKDIVVSLSLQAVSSLANKYSLSAQDAAEKIASFFLSIGCDKVFDINLARHLALIESYREFEERKNSQAELPIISSICPGWICYTEKTNGDLVIPHLSRVRSPQQIMGALLKRYYCHTLGKSRADVYHVTVMPCFDKKLEASRKNFKDDSDDTQDVDCVLTPIELEEILRDEGVTLLDFDARELDILFNSIPEFAGSLTSHIGSGSGGYAENLLLAQLYAMSKDTNFEKLQDKLSYTTMKNEDFIEINLKEADNANVLGRFAIINGFRNIQTVVQRLKRKALKYDYIEIMACPSGCINGGAQCKPNYGEDKDSASKLTKEIYKQVPIIKRAIEKSDDLIELLSNELGFSNLLEFRQHVIWTEFHAVPKIQSLTVSW